MILFLKKKNICDYQLLYQKYLLFKSEKKKIPLTWKNLDLNQAARTNKCYDNTRPKLGSADTGATEHFGKSRATVDAVEEQLVIIHSVT